MLNYKPLPEFINHFIIRPADPFELVKDIKGHNWSMYDTRQFLTDEGYKSIEDLRNGDLVKTLNDGFKCIEMIGKREIFHEATSERIKEQLYQCSQNEYPELFED